MTGRPAWTQTHLPAHATTWWQANADAMSDAAQALADHDDTTERAIAATPLPPAHTEVHPNV